MIAKPVYLDNHSTTRCDPRVVEAMLPFFTEVYGNAASVSHRYGWDAEAAVEQARGEVALLIGADPKEVIFTSGATESNNLALKGALAFLKPRGNHVVAAMSEHRAVLDPLARLAREGWEVTLVRPDGHGMVSAEAIAAALTERTVLVSMMAANNEVGTINPIGEIGAVCRARGVVFHTDAAQAAGRIDLDVQRDQVDLMSLSAHKMYGPKGIGALYGRRRDRSVRVEAQQDGGGHERGFRSGTLAVPLIVGFGKAAALARAEDPAEGARIGDLRDALHAGIAARLPEVRLNGHPARRLAGNLNLSFPGVDGEALLLAMRDVAVSSGSACTAAEPEPSHVLRAMGVDEDLARASLRFGLGRFTTAEEVAFAVERVDAAVSELRARNPAWVGGA
jgi:cysteine desulfurase